MILADTSFIDFIDSKDMKEYYKINRIDIPSDMVYFIIANAWNKSIYEIISGLVYLKEYVRGSTDPKDIEVFNQVDIFVERTQMYLNRFKAPEDGYIYKLRTVEWGHDYDSYYDEIFVTYDDAIKYLTEMNKDFHDENHPVYQSIYIDKIRPAYNVKTSDDCALNIVGCNIDINTLQIHDIWLNSVILSESEQEKYLIENPIEERYFKFPHPFKTGDIVTIIGKYGKDPNSDSVFFVSDRDDKFFGTDKIPPEELSDGDGGMQLDEYFDGQIWYYHVHGLYPMQIEYDPKEYHYNPQNGDPIENGIAQYQSLLRKETSAGYAIESIIRMFAYSRGAQTKLIL